MCSARRRRDFIGLPHVQHGVRKTSHPPLPASKRSAFTTGNHDLFEAVVDRVDLCPHAAACSLRMGLANDSASSTHQKYILSRNHSYSLTYCYIFDKSLSFC